MRALLLLITLATAYYVPLDDCFTQAWISALSEIPTQNVTFDQIQLTLSDGTCQNNSVGSANATQVDVFTYVSMGGLSSTCQGNLAVKTMTFPFVSVSGNVTALVSSSSVEIGVQGRAIRYCVPKILVTSIDFSGGLIGPILKLLSSQLTQLVIFPDFSDPSQLESYLNPTVCHSLPQRILKCL